MGTELLRLRGRGHPAIRATHGKTLELTADAEISGRATCVVGVAAAVVGAAPAGLAGWLRITVSAGGESGCVRALANSLWRPGGAAVVRRSAERLPDTLATDADLSAAQLPRALVAALADPDTVVDVVVERDDRDEHRLVRYRAWRAEDRLAAECAAADAVVAEDADARRLVAAHGVTPVPEPPAGGRVLAVSTTGATTPPVRAALARRPAVEALGVPPEVAVAWVSPCPAPVLTATGLARREVLRLAARHRTSVVVFRCPARELDRWLHDAARTVGTASAAVASASPSSGERPRWGPLADLGPATGAGDVVCALDPVAQLRGDAPPDLAPAAVVSALLAEGVSATTVATALAGQPGWSRRQAYDLVLGSAARPSDPTDPAGSPG